MMCLYGSKLLPMLLQPCCLYHTHKTLLPFSLFLSPSLSWSPACISWKMASQPNNNNSIILLRDYRKGNWTVQETMVLIEAKKMDEERRMKRSITGEATNPNSPNNKPGELRWKWVEDYCWRKGCLRSQNQCNDKWDNLMRDFKRVRDYQNRIVGVGGGEVAKSYWELEKQERKERNLPSNMLLQVYEALVDVVERRSGGLKSRIGVINTTTSSSGHVNVVHQPQGHHHAPLLLHNVSGIDTNTMAAIPQLPLPLQLQSPPRTQLVSPPHQQAVAEQPHCRPLPTVDSDTSEYSDHSPAKRQKKSGEREGERATTSTSNTSNNIIGSAISKSASLIAEAINACEEKEETRHKELMSLHQKRIQIEETKAEMTRQGINGLVDAIHKLANSVLALANSQKETPPK